MAKIKYKTNKAKITKPTNCTPLPPSVMNPKCHSVYCEFLKQLEKHPQQYNLELSTSSQSNPDLGASFNLHVLVRNEGYLETSIPFLDAPHGRIPSDKACTVLSSPFCCCFFTLTRQMPAYRSLLTVHHQHKNRLSLSFRIQKPI